MKILLFRFSTIICSQGLAVLDLLCNQILPQFPDLAWLTVNVRGCRAYIELRERVAKPPIVSEAVPSNVIAKKDALVTEVRALDGEAKVMKGMSVFEGQLLISGAVETKNVQNESAKKSIENVKVWKIK